MKRCQIARSVGRSPTQGMSHFCSSVASRNGAAQPKCASSSRRSLVKGIAQCLRSSSTRSRAPLVLYAPASARRTQRPRHRGEASVTRRSRRSTLAGDCRTRVGGCGICSCCRVAGMGPKRVPSLSGRDSRCHGRRFHHHARAPRALSSAH
jgi:hypothetical protein